jgi:IrrE N-terminal-like domain
VNHHAVGEERFAEWLVSLFVTGDRRLPIGLARLSGQLGVAEVVSSTTLGGASGRTAWTVEGPRIRLAAGMRPDRRRWAWAHELGHVMLARHDVYGARLSRRLDTGGVDEERLCDKIAGAMLVPRAYLRSCPSRNDELPGFLLKLSALSGVPTAAVARRVLEDRSVRIRLMSLWLSPQGWAADSLFGVGFSSLALCGNEADELSAAAQGREFSLRAEAQVDGARCFVWLQGAGRDGEIWAEVKHLERTVATARPPVRTQLVSL